MSEGYIVKVSKTSHIDSETLQMWMEVYCKRYSDHTDLHQLFADSLNVSRIEAKTLAHTIAFKCHIGMVNLGHC